MLIEDRFKPFIIKDYRYWSLVLHEIQYPFLGRCIAWWKDRSHHEGECMKPSDLPAEAAEELSWTIFDEVVDACKALGYPVEPYGRRFLLNTAYLANHTDHGHHMHWHFIPRHQGEMVCKDLSLKMMGVNWGKNYVPFPEGNLEPEKILEIRALMAHAIAGIA